jgi:hypothetical protein
MPAKLDDVDRFMNSFGQWFSAPRLDIHTEMRCRLAYMLKDAESIGFERGFAKAKEEAGERLTLRERRLLGKVKPKEPKPPVVRPFSKGQRVWLSQRGREHLWSMDQHHPGRLGVVASFPREAHCVGILWDGRKSFDYLHCSFVEVVPAEAMLESPTLVLDHSSPPPEIGETGLPPEPPPEAPKPPEPEDLPVRPELTIETIGPVWDCDGCGHREEEDPGRSRCRKCGAVAWCRLTVPKPKPDKPPKNGRERAAAFIKSLDRYRDEFEEGEPDEPTTSETISPPPSSPPAAPPV